MNEVFFRALSAGNERVIAWADILDRINVFPVPDGDTGRNLVLSLSPLMGAQEAPGSLDRRLLMAARGNSGNIASRFLAAFLKFDGLDSLPRICRQGRDLAYQAVEKPQPGTILTLFDDLVDSLEKHPPEAGGGWSRRVVEELEESVRRTTDQLPQLREAGVVDAGALGMLVFLDSCLNILAGQEPAYLNLTEGLKAALELAEDYTAQPDEGYCLDVVLEVGRDEPETLAKIMELGSSVVTIAGEDRLKVHMHAADAEKIRARIGGLGRVLSWEADDLGQQTRLFAQARKRPVIHVMTDAAGSVTRRDAAELGMSLLDSYINMGSSSLPETYVEPAKLFELMKNGAAVSTAQASDLERDQHYAKVMDLNEKVLYLAVGSAYTGNYDYARKWKAEHDAQGRLTVIDTGAASGRLGSSPWPRPVSP